LEALTEIFEFLFQPVNTLVPKKVLQQDVAKVMQDLCDVLLQNFFWDERIHGLK